MIESWASTLTSVLQLVEGVGQVCQYDRLPPKILVDRTVVWLPNDGPSLVYGLSSPAVAIIQVQITIYLTAALLPQGVGKAVPFIDRIPRTLAKNIQLGGTVNYILPRAETPWEGPAALSYGEQVLTGINFYYHVKKLLDFTVRG